MKSLFKTLIMTIMATQVASAQFIPENWVTHTVEDTVNLSPEVYWDLSFQLNLEETGSVGDYEDLPKITKTTPVNGNFSDKGHSRRVHFNTGETLLETLIHWDPPAGFAYELTEIEIDLRKAAHRARGHFRHYPLPDGETRIVWTYGFEQKNFIFKWLLQRYIKTTHQHWMRDTLAAMIQQTEAMHKANP